MNKTRLEAFSDGVLAIIITIMVLEIKVPHGTEWSVLIPLIPVSLSYVLSFLFIGIYWGNHHHLMHSVKKVTSGMILANLNLLFWLSLVPFGTGWMGENNFEANAVLVYGVILLLCGLAFTIFQKQIEKNLHESVELKNAFSSLTKKGIVSLITYSTAIVMAYVSTIISGLLFLAVAIMWLIPDQKIEKAVNDLK
ncbi:MAG: DUF1211 domain-containing protein [Bacteroidetes bacterium]|nr:DUF1211 domain-containing protein [Bacteroidota bacterium]